MSESIEQTQKLLASAKAATEQARLDLADTERRLADIEGIHIEVETPFVKTKEILEKIGANASKIDEQKEKMGELVKKVALVKQGIEDIASLENELEQYLAEIYRLDQKGNFAAALAKNDEMLALSNSYDFGEPLGIQRIIFEAAPWTKVGILTHQAETNVANGLRPFEEGKFQEYLDLISALPLGIHQQEHIDGYHDVVTGFRVMDRVVDQKEKGHSLENLSLSLDLLQELKEKEEGLSPKTLGRIRHLYLLTLDQYNYLAVDAFDARRDYEGAKALFALRENFLNEELIHRDFKEAVDEHDFHLRFLRAEALRSEDEEFGKMSDALVASIGSSEGLEEETLALFLALPGLGETKGAILLDAVSRLGFEPTIQLLSDALSLGMEVGMQEKVLSLVLSKKEKDIHLEEFANSLLNCRDLLDESLKNRFIPLLNDLLRSPRAHKICVKSASKALHALYGEDDESFRAPRGKPFQAKPVRPWDVVAKGLYFGLGICLPIALLALSLPVLYFLLKEQPLCPYFLLGPLFVMLLIGHFAIVARHGRDERGSAVYRRILTIDALWKAGLSLAYFALPQTLPFIQPFGYTLIIFGAVEGLWALFFYKDKKKGISIPTFVLLLLCEGASLAFLILGLMNGTL
ncbi:MAG: hypothetical protein K6E59_01380 [Bacilli bacterium]|nr:hypothetical protein [Bacilli bacterium]